MFDQKTFINNQNIHKSYSFSKKPCYVEMDIFFPELVEPIKKYMLLVTKMKLQQKLIIKDTIGAYFDCPKFRGVLLGCLERAVRSEQHENSLHTTSKVSGSITAQGSMQRKGKLTKNCRVLQVSQFLLHEQILDQQAEAEVQVFSSCTSFSLHRHFSKITCIL